MTRSMLAPNTKFGVISSRDLEIFVSLILPIALSPCTHGTSQSSFFCRFDDLLKISLNVQLLIQLTFFFASETAFERLRGLNKTCIRSRFELAMNSVFSLL